MLLAESRFTSSMPTPGVASRSSREIPWTASLLGYRNENGELIVETLAALTANVDSWRLPLNA